ncbi:hypothetical protein HYFRA_00001913 [Hymenoscyphus fraxineus]|uniref:Uncharacterized protein n=1 Tax=Hymenoscyphus fraxineus TaxID=746836 RepID=A0A9N9KKV6_9HELO|nr:hypothetical protein HYFRA_00001913 [Hymenoscyphus fraxineus]
MYFSTSLSTFAVMILSASTFVTAIPIPCTDATRDAILMGQMAPSACCVEGLCLGNGNSAARFASRNA